jgi:hypothetical protein
MVVGVISTSTSSQVETENSIVGEKAAVAVKGAIRASS